MHSSLCSQLLVHGMEHHCTGGGRNECKEGARRRECREGAQLSSGQIEAEAAESSAGANPRHGSCLLPPDLLLRVASGVRARAREEAAARLLPLTLWPGGDGGGGGRGGTVAGGWRDLSGARGDFGVLPAARPATPPPTQSQSKRERDGTEQEEPEEEEQDEEPATSAPFFFSGWIRREGYKCHSTYCYVCQRGTK
jgi:hypothetical protein